MKKNILIAFFCLLTTFSSFAQDDEEPLEYETISKDPSKAISAFYLGMEPIVIELNNTNRYVAGIGGYIFGNIRQNVMIQGRFQTPYFRGLFDGAYLAAGLQEPEGGYFSDDPPSTLMYGDFTISTKLWRFDRPNRPMIVQLNNGGSDIKNYIDGLKGDKRYQFMLRAGGIYHSSTILLDKLPPEAAVLNGARNQQAYTGYESVSIYLGLGLHKIWELIANITELDIGEKITRHHRAYYIDLMYSPIMNISPMNRNGQSAEIAGKDLSLGYLGTRSTGIRIGTSRMPDYKNHTTGFELGLMPSWISDKRKAQSAGAYWRWWWMIDLYSAGKR